MQCPKCKSAMEVLNHDGVEVDRCISCKGIWFDQLEHEELKRSAAKIDVGNASVGQRQNDVDQIKCPVCPDSEMLRMVDAKQPHIWFESCPTCYGRYFDAGEFRDFAQLTWRDLAKFFVRKPRTR